MTASRYFDIFTRDRSWLTTIPVSAFADYSAYRDIAVTSDGAVWVLSEMDGQVLKKYRLTYY
jgi:hypothetical protein